MYDVTHFISFYLYFLELFFTFLLCTIRTMALAMALWALMDHTALTVVLTVLTLPLVE
jgi:hypothetical protein